MSEPKYGKLYLIPNFLSADNSDDFIAEMVRRLVHHVKNFVVENEKQARALIKRLQLAHPQNELHIFLLNEHTNAIEIPKLLQALENNDAGIISDAGLPCVADPGSALVALAQTKNIDVIPLPGGSSMIMALMASGFNGQQFAFSGYLPIDKNPKIKRIKDIEALAHRGITQIFMETPYRNNQLLTEIIAQCNPQSKLCIACNISSEKAWVKTKTLAQWKKNLPELHKIPCVFVMGN
ncbi:MAG: SAM-dependent methyltransferase [Sphingobacteriales bacterium]|jgi:16S rRNA (cytidine1402-2'-O)-methyltransferase|nr:SAM-dependent methyltransferase [Sphingobacteriales bacterium]